MVVLKRRIVQRRFENRILWDNLQKTVPVYSGDFIRTAERSEAAITLIGDDAVTNLGENTIIQIGTVRETGGSRIDFFGGSVSVTAGSGGTVFASGKNTLVLAAGSVVSAAASEDGAAGDFAFRVTEGNAIFTGSAGTAETIRAGEGSAPLGLGAETAVLPEKVEDPVADIGPRLIVPAEGEAFPSSREEISFRWAADGDDDRIALYLFEVADNPAMEDAVVSMRVSGKRIALPPPDKGRWYWRVTPVYTEPSAAASSVIAAFSIGETVPLSGTDPVVQQAARQEAARQAAAREAAAKETARQEAVRQAAVQEAARQEAARQAAAQEAARQEAARQAAVREVAAQEAAWQEAARQAAAQETARQAAAREEAAKPLSPPDGLRPENDYVLGPAQLRTSRIIPFSWNPVPGAAAYVFSLYQETGGERQRIDTVELRTPNYTFNKLSLLERGSFIWTVQALGKGNDGTVEQGNTAENRFVVDIPELRRYTLPEAGNLYGN
jgi:hypothetical protein